MSNFKINTNELSHRAMLIKQHGQTLKTLAGRLTLQANTFNSGLSLGIGTTFNSRPTFNAGHPDFNKIASVRVAANRLSRFGNWLISLGIKLDSIVDSVIYSDNVDEDYIRQTLSELDSAEERVCRVDDHALETLSSGHSSDNYWLRSLDFAVKGDYSNEFTVAGLIGNVAIGFTPIGWVADGRDLVHTLTHTSEKSFWGNVGAVGLGLIAFVPLIGDIKNVKYLKYADEAGDVAKQVNKVDDISKGLAKNGAKIIDGTKSIIYNRDGVTDAIRGSGRVESGFGKTSDLTKVLYGERYKMTISKNVKVFQRNDIINPNATDKLGRTNIRRMEQGLAPLGSDGKPINLHHMTQANDSAIVEVTQTFHQKNSKVIHINPNTIPSGINRSEFNKWKKTYWINRANDFK